MITGEMMEERPAIAFVNEVKIEWGDCDPANIAYTGRIPSFALSSINAWWEDKLHGDGWFQMELDRNIGTPFVRIEMDLKSPITPRHKLQCHVWPCKLGETSVHFRVDGEQDGTLCFSARFVCVFIEAKEFAKTTPPRELRDAILAHLPVDA